MVSKCPLVEQDSLDGGLLTRSLISYSALMDVVYSSYRDTEHLLCPTWYSRQGRFHWRTRQQCPHGQKIHKYVSQPSHRQKGEQTQLQESQNLYMAKM